MAHKFTYKTAVLSAITFSLGACTLPPHIQDWDRERLNTVEKGPTTVAICFDHTQHSKQTVYDMALKECKVRVNENLTLQSLSQFEDISGLTQAEGQMFEGPVQRRTRLDKILQSIQLKYIKNDKWDCPVATPNRILFECSYNPNVTDSLKKRQTQPVEPNFPDMPPELPEDLKIE